MIQPVPKKASGAFSINIHVPFIHPIPAILSRKNSGNLQYIHTFATANSLLYINSTVVLIGELNHANSDMRH